MWQEAWITGGVRVRQLALVAVIAAALGQGVVTTQDARPTFKSSVELVSVAAVVRDRRGHVVRGLGRDDFEVFDSGVRRPILEFTPNDEGPVSVALLVDVSGSMVMRGNLDEARRALGILFDRLRPGYDEVALYSFDRALREERPFSTDLAGLRPALETLTPFGVTSLYDAIGDTARELEGRATKRRAILVVTDGLDNASRLTPAQVSGLASAIDVPVYVMAVLAPIDHEAALDHEGAATPTGQLANLATWTGGSAFLVSTPAHASVATQKLLADLRHQYLLAFEAVGPAGWRPLDIRLKKRELIVRARSGYFVGPPLG
jgi:Ca-activated chloride channel family protein